MLRLAREALDYVPFYCEENVWRLLARPELNALASWALIVANPGERVLTLRQRAGKGAEGRADWDYHVLAIVAEAPDRILALDLDTTLPFPFPLELYLSAAFPEWAPAELSPRFRLIDGPTYLARLVSDRSHMKGPDGRWLAPPPRWPEPGAGSGRLSVLMDWVEGSPGSPGELLDAEALVMALASRLGQGEAGGRG